MSNPGDALSAADALGRAERLLIEYAQPGVGGLPLARAYSAYAQGLNQLELLRLTKLSVDGQVESLSLQHRSVQTQRTMARFAQADKVFDLLEDVAKLAGVSMSNLDATRLSMAARAKEILNG